MKVKISDRESEAKMERWKNGEVGVFSKQPINCYINDIDMALLRKRAESVDDVTGFNAIWAIVSR